MFWRGSRSEFPFRPSGALTPPVQPSGSPLEHLHFPKWSLIYEFVVGCKSNFKHSKQPTQFFSSPAVFSIQIVVSSLQLRHFPSLLVLRMALSSTPISIRTSPSEIKNSALTQKNLEIATRALHRDGLVVLEDMVPHEILDRLNQRMVEDAYELQGRKDSPFNYHKGNIQQDPLLTEEMFFEEVYVSKSCRNAHLRPLTIPPC